jgi:GT2 family glycosyltransferase
MDLSIIIVNYNSLDFLQKCIGSIDKYLHPPYLEAALEFEIIIVDNASTDGSAVFIKKNFLKSKGGFVKLIESGENSGFSKGSNLGARVALGDYLLFLNPDTEFVQDGFNGILAFYREKSRTAKVGAIGARIINDDGSIQYSCRSFPTLLRQFYESWFLSKVFAKSKVFGSYFMTYWDHEETRKVDWLSGAFLFLKKETFYSVGSFNEQYFMYSEDTDLCLMLAKEGCCNYYFKDYTVKHHDAGTAGNEMGIREAQIWKSRKIYFSKNYSKVHGAAVSFLYFAYVVNRMALAAAIYVFSRGEKRRAGFRSRAITCKNALIIYFSRDQGLKPRESWS